MAEIKYVGLDGFELDIAEKTQMEAEVRKHAEIIERSVDNELELVIHIKEYSKTGEKHKYSVHIRASYPGGTIVSDKAHDWNLVLAVKHGLKSIEHQLEHKFK